MTINDWIHTIAGIFILLSLGLGIWVHPYCFFSLPLWGLTFFSMDYPNFAQWQQF
jgi:hypothetical protein